jgi:hypothetical protein
LEQADRLRKDYAEVAKAAEGASPMDMTALLREVETAARAAGVKIKDIRPVETGPRDARAKDRPRPPTVSVTVEASWPPLARFTHDLNRPARLIRVERALVQARPDASELLTAQMTLARSPLEEAAEAPRLERP